MSQLKSFAIAALLVFLGSVGINGTWDCWWFGDAFGNRGYLDVLAPCACVAGSALHYGRAKINNMNGWRLPGIFALALVGTNLLLWLGYLLRRYPADGLHTFAEAWLWWLK
jgi:hypothetical protein